MSVKKAGALRDIALACVAQWSNKASYAESVVYFLLSSVLKWLHKNSPVLTIFEKNAC